MKKLLVVVMLGVITISVHAQNRSPNVYVAGAWTDGVSEMACYWLNGTRHNLPGGKLATCITVAGGKVYAAGYTSDDGPCYWVDGVKYDIERNRFFDSRGTKLNDYYIEITGIAVLGGNIYVTGNSSYNRGSTRYYTAELWINGTRNIIGSESSGYSGITDIIAYNDMVYLLGFSNDNSWYRAYGQDRILSDTAVAITVSNGTVYIAGCYIPVYWINSERRNFTYDYNRYYLNNGIAAENGIIYISGSYQENDNYIPCYWRSDNPQTPFRINELVQTSGIAVYGGNIYISGIFIQGYVARAAYLVNNTRIELPGGTNATAITVVP